MRKFTVLLISAFLSLSVFAESKVQADNVVKVEEAQQALSTRMQASMAAQINHAVNQDIEDNTPVLSSIVYYPQRNEIVVTASISAR